MVVADELLIKVHADTTQAQASMVGLEKSVGRSTKSMATQFAAVGAAVGKAVTGGVVVAAAGGIKAWADFDEAMTASMAIMGDDAAQWRDKMEAAAREVGKTTLFSATEAAEAYFFLASAGMNAEQQIAAMPQVAKFAQAGMFDLATATDLATDAQSALGLSSKDPAKNLANLTRVTDVFVRANTLANTSVEQISTAMTTKAGVAAKNLGMDIEETAAILSVMADSGVKGAIAGTQLSMTLTNMGSAARNNAGAWEELGVSMFDSDGNMRNMADIIEEMGGAMNGMSDEAKAAAIAQLGFGDKAASTLKLLLGSEEAMRGYEDALRDASGFTDQVAAKQLESFKAQWELLKSKIVDIGLTIGSVLVPKLVELFDMISPWIEKLATWIEANENLALSIGGIAGAIFPVIKILTVVNPWFLAIAAAIAGIIWIANKLGVDWGKVWEGVQAKLQEVWEGFLQPTILLIEEGLQGLSDFFSTNTEEIEGTLQGFADFFVAIWEGIWSILEPLIDELVRFVEDEIGELVEWFEDIWPLLSATVEDVLAVIKKAWERVWPILQKFIVPIFKAILKIISGALDFIKGLIKTVLAIIQGDWGAAWEGIKQMFSGVWQAVEGIISLAMNNIQMTIELAIAAIKTAWDTLWLLFGNAVKSAWNGIKALVVGGANGVLSTIEGFMNKFIDGINSLIDKVNKIPGVSFSDIGHVSLPRVSLGHGGTVTETGLVRVGDRGRPEDILLPGGSTVKPLSNNQGDGGVVINLNAPQNDPIGVAREVGWELTKRGA